LISFEGIPMLSDFGVSSIFAASQVISDTTTLKGSARWMAIEFYTQMSSSSGMVVKANEKTDVWAFGMTVYVSGGSKSS
jgi:serine/threonine protein kinase